MFLLVEVESRESHRLARQTLPYRESTVSGFVLLSKLPQAAVGALSIFIVHGLLEINA